MAYLVIVRNGEKVVPVMVDSGYRVKSLKNFVSQVNNLIFFQITTGIQFRVETVLQVNHVEAVEGKVLDVKEFVEYVKNLIRSYVEVLNPVENKDESYLAQSDLMAVDLFASRYLATATV